MEYNYCRRCGGELTDTDGSFVCPSNHHTYPSPKPTAGIIFIRNNRVVLSRRAIEPKKDTLDTVGGFVEVGENFEEAIRREIQEETGLTESHYTSLKYLCSAPGPYEYESETVQVLSVFFTAQLNVNTEIVAQDDISAIEELDLTDIDYSDVGNEDVKIALDKLKKVWANNE